MNLTTVHTIDIELGLIPGLSLFALHTDKGVKLIAQNKFASFFVFNSRTDKEFLMEGSAFVSYMQLLDVGEITVLLQKQNMSRGGMQ